MRQYPYPAKAGCLTVAENRLTRLAPPGADAARTRLARLDGSRDLVIALAEGRVPPLVIHAVENRLTADDESSSGCAGIAQIILRGFCAGLRRGTRPCGREPPSG